MDKLSCDIVLKINGIPMSPELILNEVKNEDKYEIDYGDSLKYSKIVDGKKVSYNIETVSNIDSTINGGGVYFIVSQKNDKLLYIGKSKNLKGRLTQHLIKCALSTGSHILDVIDYLKELNDNGEKLVIKYCIINTFEDKNNASIEGALIDYVIENKSDPYFDKCWNKRLD